MVANPETMEKVPSDGSSMGEVFERGNVVMKGYSKMKKLQKQHFAGDGLPPVTWELSILLVILNLKIVQKISSSQEAKI